MSLSQAIVCATVFITGIIIGIVLNKIKTHKKAPWAGYIVMDYRINSDDSIGIQSPYKQSHWHECKYLTFSVKVIPPEQMQFYDRTKILDGGTNGNRK